MSRMNLSRFADPRRTSSVDLGPCRCPGTPHGRDSAEVRVELGDGEVRSALRRGGFRRSDAWNEADSDTECVVVATRSWTLLGEDGEPLPITFEQADLLDEDTRTPLVAAAAAAAAWDRAELPNASGDPSPDSRQESGSRRRRTRKT